MKADPDKTIAVVVGIDDYEFGEQSELGGPVADGMRFIRWLRDRGVPGRNITFLAGPTAADCSRVDEFAAAEAIRLLDARQESIRPVFLDLLAAGPDQCSSELLIVFWGGHGVTDQHDDFYLLFSNTRAHDQRALNFANLARTMATARNHPQQLYFVDACRVSASLFDFDGLKDDFPSKRGWSIESQYIMYAAAKYQRAKEIRKQRSGAYSQAMLASLPIVWPLDLDTLAKRTENEFYKEHRLNVFRPQTPYRTVATGPRGQSLVTLVGEIEEVQISSTALTELHSILARSAPIDVRVPFVQSYPRPPADLPDIEITDAITALRGLNSARQLLEFLVRVAFAPEQSAGFRGELLHWIGAYPTRAEITRAVTELIEQQRTEQPQRTHLQVWLEESGAMSGMYVLKSVNCFVGDRLESKPDVPETPIAATAVPGTLVAMLNTASPTPTPLIEFIVPIYEVENPYEELPITAEEPHTLGITYPVVVRPEDLLDRHLPSSLDRTSRKPLTDFCRPDSALVHHLVGGANPEGLAALTIDHLCVTMVDVTKLSRDIVESLSERGIPVALWHRPPKQPRRDPSPIPRQGILVQRLARDHAIADLPDVVLEHRRAAHTDPNHPAHDLVLLWGDPERSPFQQNLRDQSRSRGGHP
ncbi:caspase family protein [Nocardia sp. NPDC058518]|uniref:VMAP-C domain-containing protein n=1 Tax=Nocardia sp. NPDC058518 TaxID=3346534 RepID=UPI00365EBF31